MVAHFQEYLDKDVYDEHNGIPEQMTQIKISEHPTLNRHLTECVAYWTQAAIDIWLLWDLGDKSVITFYKKLAECTIIRLGCLTPKLFAKVCNSLRHDDFCGENRPEPQAINILEMTCREWLLVYCKFGGSNLGGDYVRI